MTERRRIGARPDAAAIGHHRKQPATARHHAPHFAQQAHRVVRHFQRVDEQHTIDRAVGKR